MVKLMGHLAMALLFALPAWALWDSRLRISFVGLVLATAMLPDVDLVLAAVVPAADHHGFTHTIVFVAAVSVVAGLLASDALAPAFERWWLSSEGHFASQSTVRRFVIGGFFLGGLSHIFADMLSAPDIAEPIEPLWPFLNESISFDLIYYSSIWWNLGLLIVAVGIHLVLTVRDGASSGPLGPGERGH